MLNRSVKPRWQSSISFILLFISYVSAIQQTQKILSEVTTSVDQRQLIQQSWANVEDVLAFRKFENVGKDVTNLPVGFYRELAKMITFPTALQTNVISNQCAEDSLFYVENLLQNGSDWAIQSK